MTNELAAAVERVRRERCGENRYRIYVPEFYDANGNFDPIDDSYERKLVERRGEDYSLLALWAFDELTAEADRDREGEKAVTKEAVLARKGKYWRDEDEDEEKLIINLPKFDMPMGTDERWIEIEIELGIVAICRDSEMYDDDTPPELRSSRVYTRCETVDDLDQILSALGVDSKGGGAA